jgi:1-deoxy-D-xylulose-5-phosphate reductoisomerase
MATLSFEAPDMARYPGLQLAWDTLGAAPGSTTVLNAANEIAVAAFLAGTIGFGDIHSVNMRSLASVQVAPGDANTVDALVALDERSRRHAAEHVKHLAP